MFVSLDPETEVSGPRWKWWKVHVRIQRWGDRGSGPPPPWKIAKMSGFLAILVQIPLKPQSFQASIQCRAIIARHRHASETPFKWRFAGGSLMARWLWYFDPSSPHHSKKKKKKNLVKVGPPLTNFWIRRMKYYIFHKAKSVKSCYKIQKQYCSI